MIKEEILHTYHAAVISLNKGDVLFHQGDAASYFFVVRSGRIKMSNYSDDGREFVQGYFSEGQSFGEPPFFSGSVYPASAMAVERSEVWKTDRRNFLELLRNNFEIHLQLTQTLGNRLVYKSTMLSELAIEEAGHRLLTLIRYLAEHQSEQMKDSSASVKLSFTRQQLADMTGLRVETVIRSIKTLEQKHRLEIDDDGKIIWTHPSK
jgi:CRP-like cAMP-binding protein